MNVGELAALLAAFLWAAANLLYSRISLPASTLNLAKNVLATVMMFLHLAWFTVVQGEAMFTASVANWLWLAASALIGIAIGDTVFFRSLQILGPRKALMLSILTPVFASFFGVLFLSETLSLLFLTGTALTLAGVLAVIRDRKAANESAGLFPGAISAGIGFGILSALCQAAGGVCTKIGLEGIDPEEGAFIRLLSAATMAFAYIALRSRFASTPPDPSAASGLKDHSPENRSTDVVVSDSLGSLFRLVCQRHTLKRLLPATMMGTWLGIWLVQVAYAHAPLSVAAVLLSTSPLFAIPLVRLFHHHRITKTAVIGSVIAILGIAMVVR